MRCSPVHSGSPELALQHEPPSCSLWQGILWPRETCLTRLLWMCHKRTSTVPSIVKQHMSMRDGVALKPLNSTLGNLLIRLSVLR